MRHSLHRQSGLTLLEIILVVTIGLSIILLGVKQYQSYKLDSDVQQVLYNVDQIFQAASYYYQANCKRQMNQTTMTPIAGTGTLDPANSPLNPKMIDAQADLVTPGYLKQPILFNPIVRFMNGSTVLKSYAVQFNLVTPLPSRSVPLSAGGTGNTGTIYVWKIQVAVALAKPAMAQQYLNLLRGDCLSHMLGGSVVAPCPATPTAPGPNDDYVVFTRLPSFATPGSQSGLEATNATVKQFTQQYETYPILYLIDTGGVGQNYLCGP